MSRLRHDDVFINIKKENDSRTPGESELTSDEYSKIVSKPENSRAGWKKEDLNWGSSQEFFREDNRPMNAVLPRKRKHPSTGTNDGNEDSGTSTARISSFAEEQPVLQKKTRHEYTSMGESLCIPRSHHSYSKGCSNENYKRGCGYISNQQCDYGSVKLKNERAKSLYDEGKYEAALSLYSTIIESCPTGAEHFVNRCICYATLRQYGNAFADALKAVSLNPLFLQAHSLLGKCARALGTNLRNYREQVRNAVNCRNYEEALENINKCLRIDPNCLQFKLEKAEYLALLKRYDDSQEITDTILLEDPDNIEAKYIAGLRLYSSSLLQTVTYFGEILRLAPDHSKSIEIFNKARKIMETMNNGQTAMISKNYAEAHSFFRLAKDIDPEHNGLRAFLSNHMGTASFCMGNFRQAIAEFTETINIDSSIIAASKNRGSAYMEIKDYERAAVDFSRVCSLRPDDQCHKFLRYAELLISLKKWVSPIFGTQENASPKSVRETYRNGAMLHQPFRHSNKSVERRRETKFEEITIA